MPSERFLAADPQSSWWTVHRPSSRQWDDAGDTWKLFGEGRQASPTSWLKAWP
ncbi:MAG TPA: hypothetical protein VI320_14340 [Terracidiphilus sp.]